MLMFRRIHKLHKANGPCYTAQGTSRCFCCFCYFCRKLSAVDISFSAEILGRRRFGEAGTAATSAVLSLFPAVLVGKNPRTAKGALPPETGSLRRVMDSAYPQRYHSTGYCQFDKCSIGTVWIAFEGRHRGRVLNHPYEPLH